MSARDAGSARETPRGRPPESPHPTKFHAPLYKYTKSATVSQRRCIKTLLGWGYDEKSAAAAAQVSDDPKAAADYLVEHRMGPQKLPKRCSWVVEGKLIAGGFPSAHVTSQLVARLGVRTFVNLMDEKETDSFKEIGMGYEPAVHAATRQKVIFDSSYGVKEFQADEKKLLEAAKMIKAELDDGKRVFVHCAAGDGRTGAVTAVFLGLFCGLTPDAAIKRAGDMYTERSGLVKRMPESKAQLIAVRAILESPPDLERCQTLEKLFELPKGYDGSQIIDYKKFARDCMAYMSADDPSSY